MYDVVAKGNVPSLDQCPDGLDRYTILRSSMSSPSVLCKRLNSLRKRTRYTQSIDLPRWEISHNIITKLLPQLVLAEIIIQFRTPILTLLRRFLATTAKVLRRLSNARYHPHEQEHPHLRCRVSARQCRFRRDALAKSAQLLGPVPYP
jgi:hypothetical protein